jgi:hypothetical protein
MAIWKHDCLECRYLGSLVRSDVPPVDFYVHDMPFKGSTLIARMSDEGPDYVSADADLAPHHIGPLLSIAHTLACM